MKGVLIRHTDDGKQTLGTLHIFEDTDEVLQCATLEPAWLDNQTNISSIPPGEYLVRRRNSPKYGSHWHVEDVDGRSMVLIHHGNYRRDTHGCILPGKAHTDIDGDGQRDVTSSMRTMKLLGQILPNEWQLRVI